VPPRAAGSTSSSGRIRSSQLGIHQQDRLARPWAAFASGGRCNRNTLDLLEASGMRAAGLDRRKWSGMPPLVRPLALGGAETGHIREERRGSA
jgi:hypothetical protein